MLAGCQYPSAIHYQQQDSRYKLFITYCGTGSPRNICHCDSVVVLSVPSYIVVALNFELSSFKIKILLWTSISCIIIYFVPENVFSSGAAFSPSAVIGSIKGWHGSNKERLQKSPRAQFKLDFSGYEIVNC